MIRLARSRPRWSVPRRYRHSPSSTHAGGRRRSTKRSRRGLCGATYGDNNAVATNPSRISQLPRTRGESRLLIANARVEHGVEQVDHKIYHHEKCRGDAHRRLHHWVVAVVDPLNRQTTDAKPRKNRLGDHRAAEQSPEL